jgi:hypothetical protein
MGHLEALFEMTGASSVNIEIAGKPPHGLSTAIGDTHGFRVAADRRSGTPTFRLGSDEG